MGTNYAGIAFDGDDRSFHRVLTLYRPDDAHPMGVKCLEIAMELNDDDTTIGWLVFQMDEGYITRAFDVTEESLKRFQFTER